MAFDEETINALKELGLKGSEAKVYLSLLVIGPSSATGIAKFSAIPQPRMYDIMTSLGHKGFIESQRTGKRIIYHAVESDLALTRLMKHLQSRESFLRVSLRKIEKATSEVLPPAIWIIKGRNNIVSKIMEIINNSRIELLLTIPMAYLKKFEHSITEAINRKVSTSVVLYTDGKKVVGKSLINGACIKYRDIPAIIVAMADYKYGLVLSNLTPSEIEYAIYSEDPGFLHILDYFCYYSLWKPAKLITKPSEATNFTYMWRAIEECNRLRKEGKQVKAVIKGKEVKSGRRVKFEGLVTGTKIVSGKLLSLIITRPDGTIVTVGGRRARREEVEAKLISLKEV